MKRILKIAAVALFFVLGSSWRNNVAAQPSADEEVSYQTFYDELSPHGKWIDYPNQGYVWVPDAGPDFRPYSTNGHWVYTDDYEWMWVSDYDWGWAPFHYGRWDQDPSYGWYWVPGYEWSPAWVAWRDGGDYYGWAPIRPGINISVNFSIGSYAPPNDFWCFAPRRYITSRNIFDHCYDRRQNVTIINQTTIINNYNYSRNVWRTGPRRYDVEIYAGRITPVRFLPSSRPGRYSFRNNEISIYRPNVRRDDNRNFAPRSFDRYDRQRAGNDTRIGRNDNRDRSGNNRFDRNNNRFDRNDGRVERREVNTNTNATPRDNNGRPNRGFDRRDQPSSSPGTTDRNGPRRMDNNPPRQNADNPVIRQPRSPETGNNNNRSFERRNMDRNENRNIRTDNPVRQAPQTERRVQSAPRQMERRQESAPTRQFERREQTSRPSSSNNGNGGGGDRGRRSRF